MIWDPSSSDWWMPFKSHYINACRILVHVRLLCEPAQARAKRPLRAQAASTTLIVSQLDALTTEIQRLESINQQKVAALEALKKSLLHLAF